MKEVWRIFLKNIFFNVEYLFISDKTFNTKRYKEIFGRNPDFANPITFAEKLLYLKMNYHNLLANVCADKYTVMEYVRQCGYPEILKACYQVCDKPEDIDLSKLPDKFFIQCSHTQGYNYIVEKNDLKQMNKIKKIYKQLLKRKHFKVLRENCYKYITPKIICSEYLKDKNSSTLTDYKFYCFSGKAKYFMVSYGEYEHDVKNHKFDMEWNSIDHFFKEKPAVEESQIKKPLNFDKMIQIVEKLSAPFPHVRVDLYNIDGRIIFGEMTFFSAGGFVKVYSDEMNRKIGSWIDLGKYQSDMNSDMN